MGGTLDVRAFVELFGALGQQGAVAQLIPRSVRDAFAAPENAGERDVRRALLDAYRAASMVCEQTIAEQALRLAAAEDKLASKPTKTAANEQRVATAKIVGAKAKLAALVEHAQVDGWSRIWPGHYVPVLVRDPVTAERMIRPMRYRARPLGWTLKDELAKPGCYNARKSSLRTAWRGIFGHTHGLVVASRFYESVLLHENQQRSLTPGETEQSIEIVFSPEPPQALLLACLWRYVEAEGETPGFYGFAAVTRDPPPEVQAAGHNRCIIPIRPEHVDAWLNPDPQNLAAQFAILEDPIEAFYQYSIDEPEA
ncbi:MAG: SOS response-associated peptidase family protein [Rhodanobacter sp.]